MTTTRVGLISDTHGLLRPQALDWLQGCHYLIHAGDIGGPEILTQLREIAPLTVVRGNNDFEAWAASIPETITAQFAGISMHVLHDLKTLTLPLAEHVRVVVSGHSHKPLIDERNGVFYINPGSPGPRRFSLPVSVADIAISASTITPRLHILQI